MLRICLSLSLSIFTLYANETPRSISYKFQNLTKNKIIIEKSSNRIHPIASINKLFTYFILQEHYEANQKIEVPKIQLIFYQKESRAGIQSGEVYKFSDLMFALLISSGNDVARVFEYKLKQKEISYPELAKSWLKRNSFFNTNIQEPIGLSIQTKSNINDLWKLLEMVYSNPQVFQILQYETYNLYSNSQKILTLKNRNPLTRYKNYKIFGKTGSTKKAGFCFLGFIQNIISKEIYGIIFLGADDLEKELIRFINLLN